MTYDSIKWHFYLYETVIYLFVIVCIGILVAAGDDGVASVGVLYIRLGSDIERSWLVKTWLSLCILGSGFGM